MRMLFRLFKWFIIAWIIGFFYFISQIPMDPNDDPTQADAIVVLTGGALRIDHGVELLHAGKGKKLFISGVGKNVTAEHIAQQYAHLKGKQLVLLDTEKTTLGYEAQNTQGNALEAAFWINDNHYQSIRLVTAHYHMPRSLVEFATVYPDLEIILEPVFPEVAIKEGALIVIKEYHKFLLSFYMRSVHNLGMANLS